MRAALDLTTGVSPRQETLSSRRLGLEIFLFFCFLFLLTANGRIVNRDGEAVFQVTRSIAESGRFDIPVASAFEASVGPRGTTGDSLSFATETAKRGIDGRIYSMYGLGQSLVSVPLYYVGKLAASSDSRIDSYFTTRFAVAALNPVLTALTCAILFAYVCLLGFSQRTALVIAIIYGTATMAWPYSKSYFGEPLTGLLLISAACCLKMSCSRRRFWLWYVLAGAALGFAVLVRVSVGVLLPIFALYWLAVFRSRASFHPHLGEFPSGEPSPLPQKEEGTLSTLPSTLNALFAFAAFMLPIALALGLIGWYNYARFGSPFVTGYESIAWNRPILEGLYGLLLSPGKGLLWYNPVLIVSVIASAVFFRRHRQEALLLAGLGLVWLFFHAPYRFWEGGWSWGPRLMLPILPFLVLPAATLSSQGISFRRFGSLLLRSTITLGLVVQVLGVGADYSRFLWATYSNRPDDAYVRVVHTVQGSPLIGQWMELGAVVGNAVRPGELDGMRSGIAEKQRTLMAAGLTEGEESVVVLEQTNVAGLNFPDFWFIYLYLFGAPIAMVAIAAFALFSGTGAMLVIIDRRLRRLTLEEGLSG